MRYATALCVLLAGCGGSDIPEVEVLGVSPDSIDVSLDEANDVTLQLRYADGDGDLGGGIARVIDCRGSDVVVELALPPIANGDAVGEGVAIEGELALLVNDVIALEPDASSGCADLPNVALPADGEVSFCVELVDGAGNTSEPDCSAVISLATP